MVDRTEGLSEDDSLKNRLIRSRRIIYLPIIFVFIAFRLWGLTSYGLIGDEVFTYQLAADSWTGLIRSAVSDVVHPPLFYALLKIWIALGGHSLLWIKLFPVLMSLFSIPPFILLCRELGLKSDAAKLALWLMAVNDFLINFSQELRMYSQAAFFTLLSLWLFARLYNSDRQSKPLVVGLFFANLMLVYTHYYGWFIPALEFLFLLLKRDAKIRSFLISLTLLLACFSPWVYFVSQASMAKGGLSANLDWNNPPAAIDLLWYYVILHGPLTYRLAAPWKSMAAVMVSSVFVYPLLALIRRKAQTLDLKSRGDVLLLLTLFSFLPPLVSFTLSQFLNNSVWGIRYLIIAAPTYLILISLAAVKLRSPLTKKTAICLIVVWASVSGLVLTASKDKIAIAPMAARLIESERVRSGPIRIYSNRAIIGYTLQFYLDSEAPQQFEVVYTDDYSSIRDDHFWVAFIKYRYEDQQSPQEQIDSESYLQGEGVTEETFTQKVFLFPVSRKKKP